LVFAKASFQAKPSEQRNYRAAMHDPLLAPLTLVACAFKHRESASAGLRALLDLGIAPEQIGVGAIGSHRSDAQDLAALFGVRSDIDGEDPLAGAPGLASAAQAASSVDRGGLIGGAIGALAGAALSFVPGLPITAIDPQLRALSCVLLFFILGALAGATLGGAFAPQRSTHAAFRIVDEIEHGGIAVVVSVDRESAGSVVATLTSAAGLHVTCVPADE
jgi:hypothetical protein